MLALPLLLYIMAFIGVSDIPRLPLFHRGDYSYGIYLYGYPIQQAIIAATMPYMVISAWPHFLISLLIVVPIAMASWHWVEKPILRTRKKYSLTAQKTTAHLRG
jgi:peptidoglycan/LPS O-acetylase OafA/YrhL